MSRPYANIFRQQNHHNCLSQRTQSLAYTALLGLQRFIAHNLNSCTHQLLSEQPTHWNVLPHKVGQASEQIQSTKDTKKCSLWEKGLQCLIQRKWKVKEGYKVPRGNFLPFFKTPVPLCCKEMGFFDHHSKFWI